MCLLANATAAEHADSCGLSTLQATLSTTMASNATPGVCANLNVGGGCGGLGWNRVLTGAILAGYIIVYGQCQSYTPQLVTGPLKQTPPNKLTEVLWGVINCIPTVSYTHLRAHET